MSEDYKLSNNSVFRIDKNFHVPNDINNKNWQRYLEWVSEGNTAKPQYSLEERRVNRWREVKEKCIKSCSGGVKSGTKILDSYENKKHKYNSYISEIERGWVETSFKIINDDDTVVDLNVAELKIVHSNSAKLYDLCYKNSHSLKSLIDLSDNPESIDIEAGWPVVPYAG